MEQYSISDTAQNATLASGKSESVTKPASSGASLIGSVIAGLAASACCLGPLVLVALGLGGAGAALVSFFTPLRPVFIGLALLFLGLAAYRLFFAPKVCAPGTACADPKALRIQRLLFFGIAIVVAALIAFPWYVSYLV